MFYAARSASPTWASKDVSGFLGLGAYITMFRNYKKYNFMYQLKANNKIEHMIVSFPRNLESIEFGGWNKSEDTEELETFRSDTSGWHIPATSYKVGYIPVPNSRSRKLTLNPELPYLYLPASDFAGISERINTIMAEEVCKGSMCRYDTPCDQRANISLQIQITDTKTAVIPNDQMYIPGDKLGDSADRCYLPLFK